MSTAERLSRALPLLLGWVAAPRFVAGQSLTDGSAELVEALRFRTSSPEVVERYVWAAVASLLVALAIVALHRGFRRLRPRRVRGVRWDRALRSRGFGARERALLRLISNHVGEPDASRLVVSRSRFESAVRQCFDLIREDGSRERCLTGIRSKLGWNRARGARPLGDRELDVNTEVELFGLAEQTGFCTRGVLAYRDPEQLVFRLLEPEIDVPWKDGDEVSGYFWRPHDAGYLFTATVLRSDGLNRDYLTLSHPSTLERRQRRLYVRVPYGAEVRFLHIAAGKVGERVGRDPEPGGNHGGLASASVEDLSAGGLRLRTPQRLVQGDYLSIAQFDPAEGAEVLGRVTRVLEAPGMSNPLYGIEFVGISSALRSLITRRVYQLQREFRGRGPAEPASAKPAQLASWDDS